MKKGISAISGVTSPTVGEKYTYHISEWYPNTPISEREQAKVTWELFKKRSDGRFTTTHIKKKGDSSFTFGESSVGETYRLEGYLYQPEGGGLIITPKASKIPKICKVDLNYVDDSKGSVFSFTEKLRAKAHCINMFNKEVLFTLWEDDAKGSGHNTTNQLIDTKKAKVDLYGDAEVDFMLTKALMKKAMEGETDIRELEFYVTVEYYKTKKHTTSNVEIKNPSPTENKKPSQPTAIKKAKGSPAEHKPRSKKEEKGVFRSISETIDEIWDWAETQGTAQRDKPHTIEIPEGKSPAVIGKMKVEKKEEKKAVGKCPNCDKDITVAELRQIFSQADQITLTKVAATYNKYMKELGMNTCWNKAHFFAQARIESGAGLHVKNGENLNWYWEKLISEFSAFKTPEGKINAKQWGRAIMDRTDPKCVDVSKENQKKIANWAYSYKFKKGKELGNTQENDGWNFRGKGLLQLTGRKAYAYANTYTQKEGADIITNPDLVISDVSIAVLSSMAFWKWKNIGKLTKGKTNTKEICIQVGKDIDGNHSKKQKVFTESTSKVFKTDTCTLGKHIKNDNSSTYDCAYKADSKTVYIDIIVPSNRKKEGLMVIFDNTGILFKCYALALGTGGEDRYTNGGYGNVPNGLWSTKLELNTPNTGVSFGNHGVIRLSPLAGDSLKASSRKGILIHCGHTMGDGKYGLTDNGPLMVTHGCIRVYNKDMPKITDIYEELTKNNKIIKLYVEEVEPEDLEEVFTSYNTIADPKDKNTKRKNKKNDAQ